MAARRACKAGGRDQRLVYQPRDSRRLSRVPRDEFIGFIIKRGSLAILCSECNSRTVIYISLRDERTLEIRARGLRLCFVNLNFLPFPSRISLLIPSLLSFATCLARKHFSALLDETEDNERNEIAKSLPVCALRI